MFTLRVESAIKQKLGWLALQDALTETNVYNAVKDTLDGVDWIDPEITHTDTEIIPPETEEDIAQRKMNIGVKVRVKGSVLQDMEEGIMLTGTENREKLRLKFMITILGQLITPYQ